MIVGAGRSNGASPSSLPPSSYVGIGTKITLLLCAIAVVASCAVGFSTYWQFNTTLIDQELQELSILARVKGAQFLVDVASMRDDVTFLSGTPPVQGLIRARRSNGIDPVDGSTEQQWRERMATLFTEMLRAKPQYSQIRFIGVADGGREVVRAARDVECGDVLVVPDPELQQKGQEPYFGATTRLRPGEVYLTEINLNREHGTVVIPHTPVMRAAVPIYESDGVVFGIMIINRFMGSEFRELSQHLASGQTLMLTNERGEFLLHPDPSRTFGFDLGKSFRIQQEYPQLKGALDPAAPGQTAIVESTAGRQSTVIEMYRRDLTLRFPIATSCSP